MRGDSLDSTASGHSSGDTRSAASTPISHLQSSTPSGTSSAAASADSDEPEQHAAAQPHALDGHVGKAALLAKLGADGWQALLELYDSSASMAASINALPSLAGGLPCVANQLQLAALLSALVSSGVEILVTPQVFLFSPPVSCRASGRPWRRAFSQHDCC